MPFCDYDESFCSITFGNGGGHNGGYDYHDYDYGHYRPYRPYNPYYPHQSPVGLVAGAVADSVVRNIFRGLRKG